MRGIKEHYGHEVSVWRETAADTDEVTAYGIACLDCGQDIAIEIETPTEGNH
jgi:hypothetical protein